MVPGSQIQATHGYFAFLFLFVSHVQGTRASMSKEPFFNSLAQGNDFGSAFLEQSNAYFYQGADPSYALLGAGSLRSQPYIQFGTQEIRWQTYNSADIVISSDRPIFLKNVTVNGNGGLQVTSTHTANSPFGTYAEVKVRESTFSPTGTHSVHLIAN